MKAKLKIDDGVKFESEQALFTRFGFKLVYRRHRDCLVVEKRQPLFGGFAAKNNSHLIVHNGGKSCVVPKHDLPPEKVSELLRRINNIRGMFREFKDHDYTIGMRIETIAKTMPEAEAKFCTDWLAENLPNYKVNEGA